MAIAAIYRKLLDWRRDKQAIRQLSTLSDRELNDIGLLRSDIVDAVKVGVRSARA